MPRVFTLNYLLLLLCPLILSFNILDNLSDQTRKTSNSSRRSINIDDFYKYNLFKRVRKILRDYTMLIERQQFEQQWKNREKFRQRTLLDSLPIDGDVDQILSRIVNENTLKRPG